MLLWRRSSRKFSTRRLARRAVASLLLLNWILLTVGIPLPLPMGKDRSQPFPCMESQCGCHTAAACWKSCCCHTNSEKLSWARRRGISPPAYVVAAAEREAAEGVASARKACCKKALQSGCTKEVKQDSALVNLAESLSEASADKCSDSVLLPALKLPEIDLFVKQPASEETDSNTVTLSSLLSCQGISVAGQLDLEALPIPLEITLRPWDLARDWIVFQDQHPLEVSLLPPVPPPQMAC